MNFKERFSLGGLFHEVCMLLSSPAPSHLFYIFFLLLFNIVVSVDGNFFLVSVFTTALVSCLYATKIES